jgi:hypothetical protein
LEAVTFGILGVELPVRAFLSVADTACALLASLFAPSSDEALNTPFDSRLWASYNPF